MKVVAGGPLFTMEHEQFPDVDHFVLNEAEMTLPPFLRDLEQGQPQRVYASPEFPDIRQTPVPLWGLANLRALRHDQHSVLARLPVRLRLLQRDRAAGAPPAHQDRRRRSSPSWTACTPLGWRESVFFVDDNFIGNKKHLKTEVLPALDRVAQGQDRHAVQHRGLHQPGR